LDRTYKLLGYLKDFEKLRRIAWGKNLRGVLAGWKGILYIECAPNKEAKLFSWDRFSKGL
jgi:hypothetical protein